ncbi:M24 family metallopeptidase [Amycolatopsis thermoflava]|uniref:M24 family metallopeptidase n=1 Tax=Amycolatopsis thermoflava TaxID=84480 RepID=UPI003EB7E575
MTQFSLARNGEEVDVTCLGPRQAPGWASAEIAESFLGLERLTAPAAEFAGRRDVVRAELRARGFDAILVFRASSVEYLCGHHSINPYPQPVLLTNDDCRIYVPDIELGRALASSTASSVNFFVTDSVGGLAEDSLQLVVDDVLRVLGREAVLAVELNDFRVPLRAVDALRASGIDLQDGGFLVENVRLLLSPVEVAKVEKAAEHTQRGVDAAVNAAADPDATDSHVAAAIAGALYEGASSSPALAPIVVSGRRSGIHHATWKGTRLGDELIFAEFAGSYDRYHAPVMITLARRAPNEMERRLEGMSQDILAGVLQEAWPGRVAGDVAETVMSKLRAFSPNDAFHFNFGYTVGLAHPPTWADSADWSIVPGNRQMLKTGMVFHVPASIRSVGQGMVGLSHTVLITDYGPRVLTGHDPRIVRVC